MVGQNAIEKLLDALPAAVAEQKRATIKADLEALGLWEHYRQNGSKPGKRLGRIYAEAVVVFTNHLGIGNEFMVASPEDQLQEIKRIAKIYYDKALEEQY